MLAAEASAAVTRLAIVVENTAAARAGDLLTVELSQSQGVELLERAEIERIYREQQLGAANKDYLKLGEVLGADGLILLDALKEGTNQFLDLRFIAVKPGVLLCSERYTWSLANAPDWASGMGRHLGPLIPKASVLVKDAVPLSVVSLRSATQSAESRELERQLTLLLIERLSRQREVFVLERRKMQLLSEEKELKGAGDSAFWQGCYLVEGTLDREGYSAQKLTVSVRLSPPRGGAPRTFELSCSRTNLAETAERLTQQVLAALKLQPASRSWDAADEAEQFFLDASWAYRWGLLRQAQAASESAWALGKRTEPLARLRINAYAQDTWPIHGWSGNIEIPGLPDPARLKPLLRALELFCHDSQLVFTNGGRLNEEWYLDGLRLFRASAAMLDGFYHWAELSETYQAQLAETRALTRQLLSALETKAPVGRAELRRRYVRGRSGVRSVAQELEMFDLVKWHEGGLLFERPEDSVGMFRSMLEKGYAPSKLPRIIGWTWEERKTAPKVMKQLVDELCVSTNPGARLGGLTLALIKTPFYPETTFQEKEKALAAALWECRDWILATAEHASVLGSMEEVLRGKYGDADPNRYYNREPFAGVRCRLEKEFLLGSTNFDYRRFQAIFPRAYREMPPEQARELASAMEPLTRKDRLAASICDELRRRGGLAPLRTIAAPAAPVMPAEEPLLAKFVPWRLPHSPAGDGRHLYFERLLEREGRLWSMVGFVGEYEIFPLHGPRLWVAVEPESGRCEEFPFPADGGQPDSRFEVTHDALYVSAQDHLERYRFATRRWEKLAAPLEGGAEIVAVGGRLYLANRDSVLELDPATLATQIVGSARRQPPENELDGLLNATTYTYARNDGTLGIMGSNRFLAFVPATRTLKQGASIPATALRGFSMLFFSRDGVLMRTEDFSGKRRVLAFWNDPPEIEPLLEQFHARPGRRPPAAKDPGLGTARWDWPSAFDLNASRFLAEGKNLWVLAPRKVWKFMGHAFDEPVKFSDARQATLFRFEPGSRSPLAVPVAFEKTGIEPFNPGQGRFFSLQLRDRRRAGDFPFWLETPAGFVLSAPALGGHWLLPRAALESRLARLRNQARTGQAPSPLPSPSGLKAGPRDKPAQRAKR